MLTRPRRLLMTADAVGGVWTYALELARACTGAGIAVTLAVPGPPPDGAQRRAAAAVPGLALACAEVPLEWMAASRAALRPADDWLLSVAAQWRPDLVHLNGGACHATLPWGVPVLVGMHSCLVTWWQAMRPGAPLPAEWRWYRDAAAEGLAAADAVLTPSHSYGRALEAAYGPLPHLRVVHNGRDPAAYAPTAKLPYIITAGRLWDEAKDIAAIDAAAADVPWPVLAAGLLTGPDGQTAAPRHVMGLGPLTAAALGKLLSQARIFVSLARFEPFGLAVLEAALSGCALVLSDIPTFREVWGDAAMFVAPGAPADTAAALRALIAQPDRCADLAAAARRRAQDFGAARMTEETLGLYADLLRRPPIRTLAPTGS